jgi:nucleoside-diphosphate-sugar epimerase
VRVVVFGATGNIGTSLLRALAADDRIESVLGVARRLPELRLPRTTFASADVERDPLVPLLSGADAVVHLAWRIQPSHDLETLRRTNVVGSQRVIDAVGTASVPVLAAGSSSGVYSPGPREDRVDESWPRDGVPTSFYARHKAELERRLDAFELRHPHVRVVRMRPALVFKREAASEVRRLFAGPLLTPAVLRALRAVVPHVPGVRVQAVHADDVARAYLEALVRPVAGAFNIAGEPVLDGRVIADAIESRSVTIPAPVVRAGAWLSWHARLQPSPPGWVDLGRLSPLLDWSRARAELEWLPRRTALEALAELVAGMREGAGGPTVPLHPDVRRRRPRRAGGRSPQPAAARRA